MGSQGRTTTAIATYHVTTSTLSSFAKANTQAAKIANSTIVATDISANNSCTQRYFEVPPWALVRKAKKSIAGIPMNAKKAPKTGPADWSTGLPPQLIYLRSVRDRKPALPRELRVLPDHLEPGPNRPADEEAPVHVLQDHAQLEVRQHGVEVQPAQVPPALLLVPHRRLFPRRKPVQPDLRRHERVQPHVHIDELLADLPPLTLVEPPLDLIRIDGNEPIHILHDVKRRVVHGGILAQRDRLRRRESRRRKRRQYPKLAPHIVRRRLHVRKRRPPQHPRLPVARKPVRYVRPPVPDHAPRQRIDRLDLVPKPRQHTLEIETGRAIAHSESLQRRPKCRSGS